MPDSDLSPSHRDNLVRWMPDVEGGFYESHFIKVNLLAERAAFWWKFTVLQPLPGGGPARFEVWAIFFDVADPSRSCAARETFGAVDVSVARDRLRCVYGRSVLEHGHTSGELGGRFTWNVRWTPGETSYRHFPSEGMYTGPFPKTKALSPALSSPFEGTATVDGRTFTLRGDPGMQGHNWGKNHAEQWVWTHCNAFGDDPRLVFEAVSSRIKLGPVTSPFLTILHVEDGKDEPLTVNGYTQLVRTTSDLDGLRWRFRGHDGPRGVEGVFSAPADRFVGVTYEDPNGRKTSCLNSKIADADLRILHRDGGIWRLRRAVTANAAAALEIGVKDETRGVRMHL